MILRLLLKMLAPLVEPQRLHRTSQFDSLPPAEVDVLFVGDSITQQGVWDEWFPNLKVANRGIDGNTSAQVVDRLDSLGAAAKSVFLLIGTNDLSLGVPEDTIVANVDTIVAHLGSAYPGARITVQSVMPRRRRWIARIRSLNLRLERVAAAHGASYLDLWPVLADDKGELDRSLSLDGLHLNGAGYQRWVGVLAPVIAAR